MHQAYSSRSSIAMAVKKGEAPHDRAGLPNYLSGFTAGLAADQVSAGRPAAVDHLAADQVSDLDSDS